VNIFYYKAVHIKNLAVIFGFFVGDEQIEMDVRRGVLVG
jgi:hypothetical protein